MVFTVKSGVLEKWRKSQDDFEKRKFWKKVHESDPLFYLPTLRDPNQERVHIFVYQKM